MFGILARLLEALYNIWPSYAGSIVLFTLVIMLALTPLTLKSTRSMLALQALQPEMKKLQNRYKDDRQKLNEETMKFYKEHKLSPLGGCLPMFIQLPIFFILYDLLLNLTRRGPFGADLGHAVACHVNAGAQCVNGVFTSAGHFDPRYLSKTSSLYESLSHTRTMSSWGLDLSQSPFAALSSGIGHALPYLVMVLIVIALTYLQQMQLQSRAPKSTQNATQQLTMKIMPIAMGAIYVIIPAGVVVYFLVSSLFRIGQQALVTRTFYTGPNAIAIPATAVDVTDGPVEKKSFWKQFLPDVDSMPRTGKRAEPAGAKTTKGSPSANGGSASAKAKAKSSPGAKGGSQKSRSGQGKSGSGQAKTGSGQSKGTAKQRAATGKPKGAGGKGATNGTAKGSKTRTAATTAGSDQSVPTSSDASASPSAKPSRKAPTRKGPTPPPARNPKKK